MLALPALAQSPLDPGFGDSGVVTIAINPFEGAFDVGLQPDGKIAVLGFTSPCGNFGCADIALARYDTAGVLDPAFGSAGLIVHDLGLDGEDLMRALAFDDKGRIVVGGLVAAGGIIDVALVRYRADGSIDRSFGDDGIVIKDLGGGDTIFDLVILDDGRVLAVGCIHLNDAPDLFFAARFTQAGGLDASFGDHGLATTDFAVGAEAHSLCLTPAGAVVVAGFAGEYGSRDIAVARFLPSGILDAGFGEGGLVVTDLGGDESAEDAFCMRDGRVVVSGTKEIDETADLALLRYDSSGSLDPTFGVGGVVVTDLGGADEFHDGRVLVHSDGKITVDGFSRPPGAQDAFSIVRFNPDGSPDVSFWLEGQANAELGRGSTRGHVVDSEGRIVLVGSIFSTGTDLDLVTMRFRASEIFSDGFEAGDVSAWSSSVP